MARRKEGKEADASSVQSRQPSTHNFDDKISEEKNKNLQHTTLTKRYQTTLSYVANKVSRNKFLTTIFLTTFFLMLTLQCFPRLGKKSQELGKKPGRFPFTFSHSSKLVFDKIWREKLFTFLKADFLQHQVLLHAFNILQGEISTIFLA